MAGGQKRESQGTRKYLEDYKAGRTSENNPIRLFMNSWTPLSSTLGWVIIDLICPNQYTKGSEDLLNVPCPGSVQLSSVQSSSVAQLCPTLCNPMNRSTPGLPVHHQLPEFTQTHVHWVSDAIQPSHPLLSPSPPAPNPSQHQSLFLSQLFAWGGQSTGVSALASFLPKNTQGWSPLKWTGWISLQSKGLSGVFFNTTVQKPAQVTDCVMCGLGK